MSRDLQFRCAPGTGDDRAGLPGRDPQELIASITTEPEVIFGHGRELSSLHFRRSAGAILPQDSSLRASPLSCHTSACAGGGVGLACCQVGLDRPLIPAAFVAYLFRSPTVSRPRPSADRGSPVDAPTVGDWESVGRRGRAGQGTTARTSLRGTWFKPR